MLDSGLESEPSNGVQEKKGSADQLSAKHSIAEENSDNELIGWWGVGYPVAGLRDGVFPGDHLVNYAVGVGR